MRLVVITPSKNIENEHFILSEMLDMGLPSLHVRKPSFSKAELKDYLSKFTKSQRKKIIICTHHNLLWDYNLKGIHVSKKHRKKKIKFFFIKMKLRLRRITFIIGTSCNSLSSLDENHKKYNYIIISPVFTDPNGHRPSFNQNTLKRILPLYQDKVIAHGGAILKSIEKAKETGFAGIAFQGYLWENPEPLAVFQNILNKFHELGLTIE